MQAHRPRLSQEETQTLCDGGTPADWKHARTRQIDRDGRWTLKRGRKAPPPEGAERQAALEIRVPMFGYKNPIGIDRGHGFVRRFTVTQAARHDGSQLAALRDADNTAGGVWADTAYRSKDNVALRRRRVPQFQRAKPRGRPMAPPIARGNATRARVRSRVAHVFATEKDQMGVLTAPLALSGRRPRSRWPISPTTCAG